MKSEVEISDLKRIVHCLMAYIVLEAKRFVNEEQRNEYIESYITCITTVMNNVSKEGDSVIFEHIIKGITKDLKSLNLSNDVNYPF